MVGRRISRRDALAELVARLHPGASLERVARLGADEAEADPATEKGVGYGKAVKLTVRLPDGARRALVVHTASDNDFGHDRRADRAEGMLLGFDTFGTIPRHVAPVDVGAIAAGGELRSLRDCGELYLVTEFAEGELYAEDLRRIGAEKRARAGDVARAEELARYLADLHAEPLARPARYTRAIRDLVGHGECIFGIIDGFPAGVAGAPAERLRALEARCVDWRWRLRDKRHRLRRTHGDFHPFNILFDDSGRIALLDASRGGCGDPADDVTCLSINYVFFALQDEGAWSGGFAELWRGFWREYLARSGDLELLETAPPFLAWRALVLTNPTWYPNVTPANRDALLRLAERALDAGRLDPEWAEEVFA